MNALLIGYSCIDILTEEGDLVCLFLILICADRSAWAFQGEILHLSFTAGTVKNNIKNWK